MDLTEISKKDKYWRVVALNICKDKSLADDLVQEMYLKIYEIEEKVINDYYIVLTINNIFLDICRKKNIEVDISEIYNLSSNDNEYEFNDEDLKIIDKANKLNWLKTKFLELNYDNSIREIANKYNINYGFIYRQLKIAREEILQEDYERLYKNKRFKNCRTKNK